MASESGKSFEYSDVPRPRFSVLDVMDGVLPKALPVPLFFDIDLSWAEALRARYLELGHKIAITSVLLKAIAIAQREHPLTRTFRLPYGKLVTFSDITAGFTVERIVSGTPAVFFGTIRNTDNKSILEIAKELRAYGQDPIDTLPQLDLQVRCLQFPRWISKLALSLCILIPDVRLKLIPATFGMSSVGRWGCKTGIAPCLATVTFGVGEVQDRPVAVDGHVEIRPVVSITLNFDHRIIDGAPACRFMKDVTDLLQGGLEEYVKDELELLKSTAQTKTKTKS